MNIPDGYANIQYTFDTIAGQDALTAIGVRLADPFDEELLLDDVVAAFEDNLTPFVQDGFHGTLVRAQIGTSTPGELIVFERAPWAGGSSTGAGLPPNVSTLLKKLTPRGGRKGRGRMFLPPMSEDGVDAFGIISESQFAALATAATAFLSDLITSDQVIECVLFHTDAPDLPEVITTLVPATRIVTQRRRLNS